MHHLYSKKHPNEFDKKAQGYDKLRTVQNILADIMLTGFDASGKNVADIGCASGTVYERIKGVKSFLGVDISTNLLDLHPKDENIELLCGDFDDENLYTELQKRPLDAMLSSSSLQWSKNLKNTISLICSVANECRLSLFTQGTFQKLRDVGGMANFMPNFDATAELLHKQGFEKIEKHEFVLHFDDTRELFEYIKKSGIGGGKRVLDFKAAKTLRCNYPYDYLEFEAVTAIRSNSSFSAS